MSSYSVDAQWSQQHQHQTRDGTAPSSSSDSSVGELASAFASSNPASVSSAAAGTGPSAASLAAAAAAHGGYAINPAQQHPPLPQQQQQQLGTSNFHSHSHPVAHGHGYHGHGHHGHPGHAGALAVYGGGVATLASGTEGSEPALTLADHEDRLLPVANIGRLMKHSLPANVKMTKEAKTACQIAVSEFIGLITAEASDRMVEDQRRTITGNDLLDALRAFGFEEYVKDLDPLASELRVKKANSAGGGSAGNA